MKKENRKRLSWILVFAMLISGMYVGKGTAKANTNPPEMIPITSMMITGNYHAATEGATTISYSDNALDYHGDGTYSASVYTNGLGVQNLGYWGSDKNFSITDAYFVVNDTYRFELTDSSSSLSWDEKIQVAYANIWGLSGMTEEEQANPIYVSTDGKAGLYYDASLNLIVLKAYADSPSSVATVSAMYFADVNAYQNAKGQVESFNNTIGTIGGAEKWDYGFIMVEPEEGYTVDEILYGYSMDPDNSDELSSLGISVNTLSSERGNVPEINDNIKKAMDAMDEDTPTIFISRTNYLQLENKSLFIILKNEQGDTQTITVTIQSDHQYLSQIEACPGDTLSVFNHTALQEAFTEDELTLENFEVNLYSINSTPNDAMELVEDDIYKVNKTGIMMFSLTSKLDGRSFEYNINIGMKENLLGDDGIFLSSNLSLDSSNASQGMYIVNPSDESVVAVTNGAITISLQEGASVDWENSSFAGTPLIENGTVSVYFETYTPLGNTDKYNIDVSHKVTEDGMSQFVFDAHYALQGTINLTIVKEDVTCLYTIMFGRNSFMCMNGGQTYYVNPYRMDSIFNYIQFSGTPEQKTREKQRILEYVSSGRYEISMPGANLIYNKEGKFTGNIIFYHPGSYLTVYDRELRLIVQSGNLDVNCTMSTMVKAGDRFPLSDLMNGYWDDSYQVVFEKEGFGYDSDTHIVEIPDEVDGDYSVQKISLHANGKIVGVFILYVCSEESFEEQTANIITNEVSANESLMLNVEGTDASVSADILNALKSDEDKYLVLKNKNTDHQVDWTFDGKDIATDASKDIKLNVEVDNEETQKTLEEMVPEETDGITLSFAKNGQLPGKASVRVYLDNEDVAKFNKEEMKNGISFYYLNPETKKPEKEQSDLVLLQDITQNDKYYVEVEVTHNSEFLLSTSTDLDGTKPNPDETEKPGTTETEKPGTTETEKPGTTETEKPGTTETEKPGTTETEKPGTTETEKPSTTETEKPGTTETEKPGTTQTEKPNSQTTETPTGTNPSLETSTPQLSIPSVEKVKAVKAQKTKKIITLKWKKSVGVEGYQIQISKKKNFKNSDTYNAKKTADKLIIKKYKGKKLSGKYYIRIRAYVSYQSGESRKKKVYGAYVTVKK